MNDSAFKLSLSALFWLITALVITGITLGATGMPWFNTDLPALVLVTLLVALVVLTLGGAALVYIWGKHYMAKG
jgi:hypothetical protein